MLNYNLNLTMGGRKMNVTLTKVHGSENDFFILDQTQLDRQLTENELKQVTQNVAKRSGGLVGGADGVLSVTQSEHPGVAGKMRVINADGSEASMCGNGIRTVARYLGEKQQQETFKIETMYADLMVKHAPSLAPGIATYQAEISPVSFAAADLKMHVADLSELHHKKIPALSQQLYFTAVAVPNPHLIGFVDHTTLLGPELGRIASYLNDGANPYFPDGVNVSFVEVLGQNHIFVRTYERGVGFTNACGTGMSAASLITVLEQGADFESPITVRNPGGVVKTLVHDRSAAQNYWMELIGNATFTGVVTLSLADLLAANFADVELQKTDEQTAYQNFVANL